MSEYYWDSAQLERDGQNDRVTAILEQYTPFPVETNGSWRLATVVCLSGSVSAGRWKSPEVAISHMTAIPYQSHDPALSLVRHLPP